MSNTAAHLVDKVLPEVPYRLWLAYTAAFIIAAGYWMGLVTAIANTVFMAGCFAMLSRKKRKWIRRAEAAQKGEDLLVFYEGGLEKDVGMLHRYIVMFAVLALLSAVLAVDKWRDGDSWNMHALIAMNMTIGVIVSSWQLRNTRRQRKQLD
ncbi:MAG: hypothetical protein GY811_14095 [Myxococcales bacterium]|nr:hypothetical protein [Myxococcales bacterium]